MRSSIAKKRLFKGPETTVNVNATEHLVVTGRADEFEIEYFMYSEAFEMWIKQDIDYLEKILPVQFEKLVKLARKELLRNSIQETINAFDEPPFIA